MTRQCELAETLAARLCHDIAGLGGTIANILELAEDVEQAAEALPLARDAAGLLLRRLRLSRAAWGGLEEWPADGFVALIESLATRRLQIRTDAATGACARAPASGRLLLNAALLGGELLQGRGEIRFSTDRDSVAVHLAPAPLAAAPQWPALAIDAAGPRLFQRAWTASVAASSGAALDPDGTTLRIRLPA